MLNYSLILELKKKKKTTFKCQPEAISKLTKKNTDQTKPTDKRTETATDCALSKPSPFHRTPLAHLPADGNPDIPTQKRGFQRQRPNLGQRFFDPQLPLELQEKTFYELLPQELAHVFSGITHGLAMDDSVLSLPQLDVDEHVDGDGQEALPREVHPKNTVPHVRDVFVLPTSVDDTRRLGYVLLHGFQRSAGY